MKQSTNAVELRDTLLQVHNELLNGERGISEVKVSGNIAGKIIATIKIQLEYNKMVQSKKEILFMNC